jgi:hypothetical protein
MFQLRKRKAVQIRIKMEMIMSKIRKAKVVMAIQMITNQKHRKAKLQAMMDRKPRVMMLKALMVHLSQLRIKLQNYQIVKKSN